MFATLFDHIPAPPAPPLRTRKRRAPSDSHVKYTRYPGKGRKEQVRFWVSGWGSVNCGLYDRDLAPIVKRKLVPLTRPPRGEPLTPLFLWHALCTVLSDLAAKGADVPEVLPMYVERVEGGFAASVKKAGRVISCPVPFTRPEDAHNAILAKLAEEFPAPPRRELVTLLDYWLK